VPKHDRNTQQEAMRDIIDPVTGMRCPTIIMSNRRFYLLRNKESILRQLGRNDLVA